MELTLAWQKMAISRVSWREKLTDLGVAVGTLVDADGSTTIFPRIEIPKTTVRLVWGVWWVDACEGIGTSTKGDKITVKLPMEPCGLSLETGGVAALSIPYDCTITRPDGTTLHGELIAPDCPLNLVPLYALPITFSGDVS